MRKDPSVEFTVSNKLCTGCGICEDVCPKDAIIFHQIKGINIPVIDDDKCINDLGCSRCFQVCSGIGIKLRTISKKLFSDKNNFDYYVGYYFKCYSGHSNDYDIRFHSASGGLISQLLIYLLKTKIINGAVITRFKEEFPTVPETIIATTEKEIISGKSSKYCPVSLNGLISQINSLEGKYVVVGLPCHIHGFRKYEEKHPRFKNKIFSYFSLFCSGTRTNNGTDFVFSRYKIDKNEVRSFAYRDDGCLGYMKVITEKKQIKIPFLEYYTKLRSFFKPKRCLYCVDHFGDLADISFGDIHTGIYRDDKIGINSVVTRNHEIDRLLQKVKNEDIITLDEIPISILKESQKHMLHHKKRIAALNMKIERSFGSKVPEYDVVFQKKHHFFDYIIYLSIKFQRQLGKNKFFWFIIDIYNKIASILGKRKRKS